MRINEIPQEVLSAFRQGVVIPAMPLALHSDRTLDLPHQKAVLRYYIDAGVGGIAVGVHSTQFEIREPKHNLFQKVLGIASAEIDSWCAKRGRKILKVAGICGKTEQALTEVRFAREAGYHACLLSLTALKNDSIETMLQHCARIAEELPVIGFYLQPAVGGRVLPYAFWRKFVEIENILAIKVAPFNRYQTFDVVRALAEAGKAESIPLYTGNDDSIVTDLLTPYVVQTAKGPTTVRFTGGLLGHWGVWTQEAVKLLEQLKKARSGNAPLPAELLTLAAEVTDVNAVVFDAANAFRGCIPGIHEMLRRQGLLEGTWCLNPEEVLSPGQSEEIDRINRSYPHLSDRDFTTAHLQEWLAE